MAQDFHAGCVCQVGCKNFLAERDDSYFGSSSDSEKYNLEEMSEGDVEIVIIAVM